MMEGTPPLRGVPYPTLKPLKPFKSKNNKKSNNNKEGTPPLWGVPYPTF